MELKSWRQFSSSLTNLSENTNNINKDYYQNNINDTDDSELIETRIPPKAATPFIPIESFNHSFFNSVSENSSNFNNNNNTNNNILEKSLLGNNVNTNSNASSNNNTPKPRKKSVIFKDEVDEVPNDDTSFSLTLERNFNKNFSGNTKYESILQSSPPSQFNSGFNSYDPSPISFNVNVYDSEKPILLNHSVSNSPQPARRPSILKTSIHYHKIIDNTTSEISDFPAVNSEEQRPTIINDNINENDNKENIDNDDKVETTDNNNNSNVDDSHPYFDNPETNITDNNNNNDVIANNFGSNPSLHSSTTNSNIDLNNIKINDNNNNDDKNLNDDNDDDNKDLNDDNDNDHKDLNDDNDNDTTVSSSFGEIPIETLKDFNPDESEIIDDFAAANTSTNIINNMKFKNDTTQSPFISALSFNSLSWNDNSSFISINHNGRRHYSNRSSNRTSPIGSSYLSGKKYKFNESESATSHVADYYFVSENSRMNANSPQNSLSSSNRNSASKHQRHPSHRLNEHRPIHENVKISLIKSINHQKKENHDYDNFLEESNSDLPYFYQKNVKYYQDVNGPYPQEELEDDINNSKRSQASVTPVKHIRYPKHHYHSDSNSSFMGDRTQNGFAIHKGLQLASKDKFYQKNMTKLNDKHWNHLEIKSKKFYNVRKKQRENRFKRMIQKKVVESLPIAKKVEKENHTKLIHDFEKLTVKRQPLKIEKDDILIVDPRMIEKLDRKSKILPIQNELDKREINKLNNRPLDVKTLPSSYVFQSIDTNISQNPGPKYDTKKLNTMVTPIETNETKNGMKKHPMLRASSLPVLVHKAKRADTSMDNPVQQNSPPHPHSPPPKPPSLLHEKFEQLYFDQDDYSITMDNDDDDNDNDNNQFEEKDQSDREEEKASSISSYSNATDVEEDHQSQTLKKSISEPYLKSKYDTKVIQLERPTLNSTQGYIKNKWNGLRDNKTNFKHLEKQIKDGMNETTSTLGRKTFIDQIIRENSKKREYYYKNYLTEKFGEDRQHLVQNHLDQFKQKLKQEELDRGLTVNGIKISIDQNGDVDRTQTKKAVKYISNRIANKVTTVQPSENQYINLISLQDPVELPQDSNRKNQIGTSYIPRAKKVVNKSWLASLEIKPPSIEEM